MKKLCIIFTLLTSSVFISTQSMLKVCLGSGIAGLGYSLYREISRNDYLGTLGKVFRMGATEAGLGSPIQRLRLKIQNFIYNISADKQEDCSIDDLKAVFKIEKIVYGSTIILGLICTLYGLKDFLAE